jgi:predicted peptidase
MTQINIPLGKEAGVPYGYLEYRPESATRLLVHIHGYGERGNGTTELNKVRGNAAPKLIDQGKFSRTDFIVVSPQYASTASMAYHTTLFRFIRKMIEKYKPESIHLIGLSGGGISVWKFLINLQENNTDLAITHPAAKPVVITSAVIVAGDGDPSPAEVAEIKGVKLWVLHGERDDKVKPSNGRKLVETYNLMSPAVPARYTNFPFEAHSAYVWETTYKQPEIYEFMTS